MKTTLTLSEDDIKIAIVEYIERLGYKTHSGNVRLFHIQDEMNIGSDYHEATVFTQGRQMPIARSKEDDSSDVRLTAHMYGDS